MLANLSRMGSGLEKKKLFRKAKEENPMSDFEVVIVGSGFGGSIAAYKLAEAGFRVAVLERGKNFNGKHPFPTDEKAVWEPKNGVLGHHDFTKLNDQLTVWRGSGIGGTSNLFAGVLLRSRNFDDFPDDINEETLAPYYDQVEKALGANPYPVDNPDLPYYNTKKTRFLQRAAEKLGGKAVLPPLAISFKKKGDVPNLLRVNKQGVYQSGCTACGQCSVPGCDQRAKNSLSFNYIPAAKELGAKFYPKCDVECIQKLDNGEWGVSYVTRGTGEAEETATQITCKLLVLSAGSLGSTEILLKSRDVWQTVKGLSDTLGTRFTTNGSMCGFGGFILPAVHPEVGPEITVGIPFEGADAKPDGFWIFDGGYKKPFATLAKLVGLPTIAAKLTGLVMNSAAAIGAFMPETTLPLLSIGRDQAVGKLKLDDKGNLTADINLEKNRNHYERVEEAMKLICSKMGAKYLPHLSWRVAKKIEAPHPLGACPMGTSIENGVVDSFGRVFGQENLVVLDASIIPGSLGVNPALTIASLALRGVEEVIKQFKADGKVTA